MAQADGSILVSVDLNTNEAEKELARLKQKILKVEETLSVSKTKKTYLETSLANARAELERIQSMTTIEGRRAVITPENIERISKLKSDIAEMESDLEKTEKVINNTNILLEGEKVRYGEVATEAARLQAISEQTAEALEEAAESEEEVVDEAERAGEALEEAGDAGEDAGRKISAAMEAAQKRLEKFEKRVVGLAKRVFVFTLISKALRSLKDYLWQNIQTSAQAQAAIAKLRGALLTLAQPLVNVIIPAFTKLVELLAKVAATAAKIVSKLFGQTVETTAAQAEESYNARNALKDESKALKDTAKAAKEAEKQLADFDEIQKLTSDTAEDNADLSGAGAGLDTTENAPDFSSVIDDQLSAIIELFAGAALLALGAILTFSGANIPLGIALMVLGALAIWDAISENKEAIVQWIKDHSDTIALALTATAAVALVVGIILLLTGHILIGIGLIVLGIALFAAAAALNKDAIIQFIKDHSDTIAIALLAAAAIAVVIGIVLLVAGKILIGITLIILGIALFVTAFQMSDEVQNWVQEHMETITTILLAAAAVAVIVGIILLFTPKFLLGIGLILVGIALFAAAVEINDELSKWIEDNMSKIAAVVGAISAALVVIGIILLFTGAGIPIGLGLILAGIAGLSWAQEQDPDWDWLKDKLAEVWDKIAENAKTAWEAIKQFFSDIWDKIKGIFDKAVEKIKKTLSDTWDKVKDGAKQAWDGVKETISGIIDKIVEKVESFKDKILPIVEKVKSALSGIGNSISSVFGGGGGTTIGVSGFSNSSGTFGISSASIPGLARGAVIPPNREFLAVLGDQRSGNNIEAPEAALQAMANQAASANAAYLERIIALLQEGKVMMIGSETFARLVYNTNRSETARHGGALVNVSGRL